MPGFAWEMPRLPRHRDAPDWHRKARAREGIAKAKQGKAVAKKSIAKHWNSRVWRRCGMARI